MLNLDSLRRRLFIVCFVGFGCLIMVLMVPGRRSRRWLGILTRFLAWYMQALVKWILGFDLRIEGGENIPHGPAIIASNHESAWDALIFYSLVPNPVYVAKKELTRIPLFGGNLIACGHIVIDRQGGAGMIRRLCREVNAALALGRQVIIFPEGTRNKDGSEGQLKGGIDLLAHHTRCPIIPVTHDSGRAWYTEKLGMRGKFITLTFHPPLREDGSSQSVSDRLSAIYRAARRGEDGSTAATTERA